MIFLNERVNIMRKQIEIMTLVSFDLRFFDQSNLKRVSINRIVHIEHNKEANKEVISMRLANMRM